MDRGFYAFGTMNYIRIDSMLSEEQAELLSDMQARCDELDDLLSAFKENSDIGRINAAAGRHPVAVRDVTFRLLERALYFAEVSGGAFDPTIRPAVELWNIGNGKKSVPSEAACQEVSRLVDYTQLHLDREKQTAFLEQKGQGIDLGGIAKGYAGDAIRSELMDRGVISGLLNFGGTILTIGKKSDGSSWKAGIQNPLRERGSFFGQVTLDQDALVTSGVNERFFMKNGIRYHHLLDPRTCSTARSGVLSVTAAGSCAMDLDGITTALFVLGVREGIPLAERLGIEALYLAEDGNVISTKGFAEGKYHFHMNTGMQNGRSGSKRD